MKVILDGERLEELHRGLGADLGHPVEEEHVLGGLLRVVEVVGVQLESEKKARFSFAV